MRKSAASLVPLRLALGVGLAIGSLAPALAAEGETPPLKEVDWSFQGVLGHYDNAQLRRGYRVYNQVCASCHGLRHLSYRNLGQIGFNEEQVKAFAAAKTKTAIDDAGDRVDVPREPNDRFAEPFANEQLAKAANNGAFPPDLSLMAKARPGGPEYIYSLLTGYVSEEECGKAFKTEQGQPVTPGPGQYCNAYFPGHILSMAPPITSDGQVEYPEDAPTPTVQQMARDVTAFLQWAAEPHMEERKRLGIKVILFLLLFTGLMYGIYRKVWAGVKH